MFNFQSVISVLTSISPVIYGLIAIIYFFSLWIIFKKMGRPGWESVVPVYRWYIVCYLLYGNGWKFLFFFVPIYNIYFIFKYIVDFVHAFHKGTGFVLGVILVSIFFIPYLAFSDAQFSDGYRADDSIDAVTKIVKIISSLLNKAYNKLNDDKKVIERNDNYVEPKVCPNCGTYISKDTDYCYKCGYKKGSSLDEYKKKLEEEKIAVSKEIEIQKQELSKKAQELDEVLKKQEEKAAELSKKSNELNEVIKRQEAKNEELYFQIKALVEKASTSSEYAFINSILRGLGDYKDAKELLEKYTKIEENLKIQEDLLNN